MIALSHLEENIYELSLDEQLWLIKRLAQHIRQAMVKQDNIEARLQIMADDTEIQTELQLTGTDFAFAK